MSLFPLGLLSQGGGDNGGNALTLISTVSGNGSSSSITFSSIPSTYKHLQLRYTARATGTSNGVIQFNSVTSSASYFDHNLRGNGTSASSFANQGLNGIGFTPLANTSYVANVFGTGIVDILDYTNTNKNKVVRTLAGVVNSSPTVIYLSSGVWLNTAAISTLTITNDAAGAFATGSRFSLYGVS